MSTNEAQQPDPVYAVFAGLIDLWALNHVARVLTSAAQAGRPVHMLMQSTGGNASDGVGLYNLLKGFPVPPTLYNIGTISSAAVIGYLGAPKRITSRHASFMIHRPSGGTQFLNADRMQAQVTSLQIDDARTEAILRERIALPEERWRVHEHADLWLTATEAKEAGIATDIAEFAPPLGSLVVNVLQP